MQWTFPVAFCSSAVRFACLLACALFVKHDNGVELRVQAFDALEIEIEQFDTAHLFAADSRCKLLRGKKSLVHRRSTVRCMIGNRLKHTRAGDRAIGKRFWILMLLF